MLWISLHWLYQLRWYRNPDIDTKNIPSITLENTEQRDDQDKLDFTANEPIIPNPLKSPWWQPHPIVAQLIQFRHEQSFIRRKQHFGLLHIFKPKSRWMTCLSGWMTLSMFLFYILSSQQLAWSSYDQAQGETKGATPHRSLWSSFMRLVYSAD